MPAKATVVVFSQQNVESRSIPLTQQWPGVYRLTSGAGQEREAARKRFLPSCAWAAVVVDDAVLWLHVGNSWATYTKAGQTRAEKSVDQCFVSFSDPAAAAAASNNNTLTVHAFAGVLKLEEHIVTLE